MPNTYNTLGTLFTAIANAIRTKKGTSASIVADNFPSEILSITPNLQSKSGGIETSFTGTFTPDSGYDGLSQVIVSLATQWLRFVTWDYNPTSDASSASFSSSWSTTYGYQPAFAMIVDKDSSTAPASGSFQAWFFIDWGRLARTSDVNPKYSTTNYYGVAGMVTNGTATLINLTTRGATPTTSNKNDIMNWVTANGFRATSVNSNTRYFRSGRSYRIFLGYPDNS